MRRAAAGALLAVGLVLATLVLGAYSGAVFADRPNQSPVTGSGQLVTYITPLGDNRQQLVVIDPELHVMSIYHLGTAGEITLKSVRNFHWDLQMEQFNGASPLPREIRAQLQPR